jgi:hypothetical protein
LAAVPSYLHKTVDFELEVYGSIDLIGHVGKDDRLCVHYRLHAVHATCPLRSRAVHASAHFVALFAVCAPRSAMLCPIQPAGTLSTLQGCTRTSRRSKWE